MADRAIIDAPTRASLDVIQAYLAINAERGALRDLPPGINSREDLVCTAANLIRTIDAIDRAAGGAS